MTGPCAAVASTGPGEWPHQNTRAIILVNNKASWRVRQHSQDMATGISSHGIESNRRLRDWQPWRRFMFYIYGLREAGSDEYRYVGSTKDPRRRMWGHAATMAVPAEASNTDLYKWMLSATRIEMDILEESPERRQAEEQWINKLRWQGHRLFNIRSATQHMLGMNAMSAEQRRETVARYLDTYEELCDKPWLKW